MKTIGVDLHACSLTATAFDDQGEVVERRDIPTKCRRQAAACFASSGSSCQVTVESVGFSQWFWNDTRSHVDKFVLTDPAGVKSFVGRKAKTDRNDSRLLAKLLRADRLPMAYVPAESVRQLRDLARLRHRVARTLASERRQLREVMLKNNLPGSSVLTSDRSPKWLLAPPHHLRVPNRLAAEMRLDHITRLERDVTEPGRHIGKAGKADPELDRQARLIASVPGIGKLIAATILTERGDRTRFKNIDPFGASAGLAPTVSQSGESIRHGHIAKRGSPVLRWILQQAAWVAIRSDLYVRSIFARIGKRAGPKKTATAIAIARKLLAYAWSVSRHGAPFLWPGESAPPNLSDHWSYEI
ncbi:MAG: IS110 family transposase [Verrucomicrobiae bacterium]|nr:IS110 family transposase [Verrucomicrobiae bacterium]